MTFLHILAICFSKFHLSSIVTPRGSIVLDMGSCDSSHLNTGSSSVPLFFPNTIVWYFELFLFILFRANQLLEILRSNQTSTCLHCLVASGAIQLHIIPTKQAEVHCYLRCIHDCRCLFLKLQGKERHEIMRVEQRQAISLTSEISLKCSPRCRNYNLRTVYHRELGKFSCVFLSIHFNFELVLMISTLLRACSLFS